MNSLKFFRAFLHEEIYIDTADKRFMINRLLKIKAEDLRLTFVKFQTLVKIPCDSMRIKYLLFNLLNYLLKGLKMEQTYADSEKIHPYCNSEQGCDWPC